MRIETDLRRWRTTALLCVLVAVASWGLPAAWASWGSPPEARSRVLALPDGTQIGPGATGAPLPTSQEAALASSPTANAVAAGVDVTIPAVAGQLGVCVQSRDSAGIVCVGGWGGTGVLCDEAIALNASAVDGQAGGAVCLPTTAAITVGASVAGPLDFVWWRI